MKKVLVISYYWPPSGGIGVLRTLKFVKYLRNYGWEPILVVPSNATYPYLDENNYKDVPENLEVLKCPIMEPFGLFKKLSGRKKNEPLNNPIEVNDKKQNWVDKIGIWIRGNFFIPDARALWIRPTVKRILSYLEDHKVDAIFTDGPPHTNTRIGYLVAQKTGLPWLADFQDPWTQVDYLQKFKLTKYAWKRHRKMEQLVFERANKITAANPGCAKQLESIGAKNISSLYYGYDEDDFKNIVKHPNKKFTITHAGLLGADRSPDNLFKILKQLSQEFPDFGAHLEICLMGQVDISVIQSIKSHGLAHILNLKGTVSRLEVLQEIMDSHILLLCINKAYNASARIPAKVFEYLRTGNPILALGPSKSDITDLLTSVHRLGAIQYENEAEIYRFVKEKYLLFKTDADLNTTISQDIKNLSNELITKDLAVLLNSITP